MAGPTKAQRALLSEIEGRAVDLNRLLDVYEAGMENAKRAKNKRLVTWLDREIAFTLRQLAELHARRDMLRRELQGTER